MVPCRLLLSQEGAASSTSLEKAPSHYHYWSQTINVSTNLNSGLNSKKRNVKLCHVSRGHFPSFRLSTGFECPPDWLFLGFSSVRCLRSSDLSKPPRFFRPHSLRKLQFFFSLMALLALGTTKCDSNVDPKYRHILPLG